MVNYISSGSMLKYKKDIYSKFSLQINNNKI
jgi:hypothetical protein